MNEQISWDAEEFEHRPKSNDWYWAVGIITAAIAVASIMFENIFLAIFIVISSLALILQSAQKPRLLNISIDNRGILINKRLFPFNSLESFWLEKTEHEDKLIVKSKKALMPFIIIPVHQVDSMEIEQFLIEHLKEEELHEPLAQKIMERLGF
ncbi:hypothetical protein COW81_02895 [Candidatus Campbellbacteria bacterium CG22_combo_CG10-13_8_21_14_all_36_13]|uniref:DUF5673 domain-containing protein n=1 Tax=Candidatus Campbellbacteria bacterium CG22_combo_CG10-13_8_21_14_all_36_13 TaxID=1974529 RepID=A0A2H0DXQ5_9BACT|nr:MAG: hypothetical protein COW81_02895 [Candidatus Campbellbacteria bacterium CG22_combo_CG10-13_8_21_14_all_36_13]